MGGDALSARRLKPERVGLKRLQPGKWAVYFGPYLAGELHDGDPGGIRAVVYLKKSGDKSNSPLPRSAGEKRR